MLDLLSQYLDKGYQIFFDNFYTSLTLVKDLLSRNTFAYGTIRINRGEFPDTFKNAKLKPGNEIYIKNGDIMAVHWKEKRDVFLLSSFHGTSEKAIERYTGTIQKPDVIVDCNQYMGGADKCDQYLSYYYIGEKAHKWWKTVFFSMCQMCITNSMCIYTAKNPDLEKEEIATNYREILVHQLVQPYLDEKSATSLESKGRTPSQQSKHKVDVPDSVHLCGKHYATKRYPRRKCCFRAYKLTVFSEKCAVVYNGRGPFQNLSVPYIRTSISSHF